MNPRIYYRDRAQRELIHEAINAGKHVDVGAIHLKSLINLGPIPYWESQENITLAGIDSNSGCLFDRLNRIVRYQDVPTLWLLKIHRLIVKKKQYEIREENRSKEFHQ